MVGICSPRSHGRAERQASQRHCRAQAYLVRCRIEGQKIDRRHSVDVSNGISKLLSALRSMFDTANPTSGTLHVPRLGLPRGGQVDLPLGNTVFDASRPRDLADAAFIAAADD